MASMQSERKHLRARDNPLATCHLESLSYRFESGSLADLMERLEARGNRGAIVGPQGAGKTVLIETIARSFQHRQWCTMMLQLREGERHLPSHFWLAPLSSKTVVLIDGCEQLSALEWQLTLWKSRRAGGFVVTSHAPGRLPEIIRCRPSLALMSELACELLGYDLPETVLKQAFEGAGGNIREAFLSLYDSMADNSPWPAQTERQLNPNF